MFSSAPGQQEANRVTHGMSRCVIAFLTAFAAFGHLRYGCGMLWLWDWCCQMLSVSDQMPKIGIEMVRVLMILVMMFFFSGIKHIELTISWLSPGGLGASGTVCYVWIHVVYSVQAIQAGTQAFKTKRQPATAIRTICWITEVGLCHLAFHYSIRVWGGSWALAFWCLLPALVSSPEWTDRGVNGGFVLVAFGWPVRADTNRYNLSAAISLVTRIPRIMWPVRGGLPIQGRLSSASMREWPEAQGRSWRGLRYAEIRSLLSHPGQFSSMER